MKTTAAAFLNACQRFFHNPSAGGLTLIFFTLLALVVANSPFAGHYETFLSTKFSVLYGDSGFSKTLLHWINDGLMALFFFLIGLEVKREVIRGELSNKKTAILSCIAAAGGMLVPVGVYLLWTQSTPEFEQGWAIPAATDIAFVLGILALLGRRVPIALKVLLTAIAVIDDIGAVVIIAVFYTTQLSITALYAAGACLIALSILNRLCVERTGPYLVVGLILWAAVLETGIHATLAGVATAFFIPVRNEEEADLCMGEEMEHALHPWVTFIILPLFAFANAGIPMKELSMDDFTHPITIGITLGLFFGKQIGIFLSIYVAHILKIAKKPRSLSWAHVYGLSVLCGVGFTMSLFIGTLAFGDTSLQNDVRLGVLMGSFLSALLGTIIIYYSTKPKKVEA